MNDNQFRQAPQGAIAPQSSQSSGGMNTPLELTKQFYFSYRSEMDGKLYEGQFTTKKLSMKDYGQLGVRRATLNGGFYFDEKRPGQGIGEDTDNLNSMIAHLELSLIQKPMWWNLDLIYDPKLVGEVYQKVMEFENSFFRSNRQQTSGAGRSQNDSSTESEESRSTGRVKEVGREEVQPSLDP